MKKLLIKVCGLTDPANIQAISQLNVDMLGFIFYPPSPRYIAGKTTPEAITAIRARQKKVGVFVRETVEKIRETVSEYGLDGVQLHGQETPAECHALRGGSTVLKAFPIASPDDFEQTKHYEGACDYFLFDTKGPSHGGNGFAFDWSILEAYSGDTPFFLSGGIGPQDAGKIGRLRHPQLAGLDLNSRFETAPGIKDPALLQRFLQPFTWPFHDN